MAMKIINAIVGYNFFYKRRNKYNFFRKFACVFYNFLIYL